MAKLKQTWYREWFDSKHYDLLYRHRDQQEAKLFIVNLFNHLNFSSTIKVLDLACGKGRHSVQVNQLGYNVIGLDLSKENVKYASQFEKEGLNFECGDMRHLPYSEEFDLVLNLFTSFGYFEDDMENFSVIQSIANSLNNGGILVLDFLNVRKVIENLPSEELIQREGISFRIRKYFDKGAIIKDIYYQYADEEKRFIESVKSIELPLFESYFERAKLKLKEVFGDYKLNSFDHENSERLIMIVEKTVL